jgi:hypothetical protein
MSQPAHATHIGWRVLGYVPKRLLLAALLNASVARSRDLGERNLPFTQLTIAVIIAVVIQGIASSFSHQLSFANYRAILLLLGALLLLEMYIVLVRYHDRLRLPYVNLYMFTDLLIAVLFVTTTTLIVDSWTDGQHLRTALQSLALLMLALLLRQIVAFADLVLHSSDAELVLQYSTRDQQLRAINLTFILRNHDLSARLQEIHFSQGGLIVPMIADLFGIGYAISGLVLSNLQVWAWLGLLAFLVYELIMFGFLVGGRAVARRFQTSLSTTVSEKVE